MSEFYKCKHFTLRELVSPAVYKEHGEFAWRVFDEEALKELDYIREKWDSSIIINNWSFGGAFSQSGLRCNTDPIVIDKINPYISAHMMGKGFDLKDSKGRNKQFYAFIWGLLRNGNLKYFKRLEHIRHTSEWVHIDAFRTIKNQPEIFTI